MKRTFTILLALVLCFQLFAMGASAADATISLTSAEGQLGDEITVSVKISGNPGLAYLKLKVGYDSSALTLLSVSNAGLLGGTFTPSQTISVNPQVLQWMAAGNSTGDGVIATLKFKINENATVGKQTISLQLCECYNEEFDDVTFATANSTVTITKPACNHVWDSGKVTTAAGCTTAGVKTYTCTVAGCGQTKTESIAATGHKFGAWKVTTAATCTEDGEEVHECATCGLKETRKIAAGHTFGEWEVTKAATCTEDGEETRKCSVCGETETREVAAGHALNSYGKDATYHWELCDNCDYIGEKTAHSYDYNGVCVCGAAKPVETNPDLDDVPKTGDITPYIVMTSVLFACAAATFVLKRKAVK